MSRKKLHRDRKAGFHFHWHLPHGSVRRFIIAGFIATLFWGSILAYVQVRLPAPPPLVERASDLEVINLDDEANRWLSELVDRESPFALRWDVSDDTQLSRVIDLAVAEASPRTHRTTLQEVTIPAEIAPLKGIPGFTLSSLPPPEPLAVSIVKRPDPEWWIKVQKIEGAGEWKGTSFRWEGGEDTLSPGVTWTFQLGLDWRGRVISCLPLEGRGEVSTREITETLSVGRYPAVEGEKGIRWWLLEANVVDRSAK